MATLPYSFVYTTSGGGMTLLQMIQGVCRRVGIPAPNVVATATDATVLQLLDFAQEEGAQLARYGDWRVLRKEHTFVTVAAETQTDTPIPADWAGFIDGTFWNRSQRERLYGPATPEEWQAWKSQSTFPISGTFYLRGTSLLIQPTPTAGDTIAYEYRSSQWCQSSGGDGQDSWQADTDTGILSERLMGLGVVWRFKQSRGLDWQADYTKYEFEVQQALAADQPRRIVNMSTGGMHNRVPGVVVPEGHWNL